MNHHPEIYLRSTCRACKGHLQEVLNLGNLRLNGFPKELWEMAQILRVPLVLTVCTECGLAQLDRTVPADWMYRQYWYRSGVNEMMVDELRSVVEEALSLADPEAGDHVLDIGANDGTLLSMYADPTLYRVAVEPALNLHERLRVHCDQLIPDYFPGKPLACSFKIISAIAMAYDLEDPCAFFHAIHDHLAPGGVAVIQFQDFEQQLACAAFDNIGHEHLEYYTLWSLTHLFRQTGLTIQRVRHTPINGGSLRVILRRAEDRIRAEQSVADQLLREARVQLDTPTIREGNLSAFQTFHARTEQAKTQIASVIETARAQGCTIDVYGASTKGNVLLQVLGLGPDQIRQAIDRSPEKHGYRTITGIPIVGEEAVKVDPPDVFLVPIWQFRESVLRREGWFLDQGGTLIFPLPCVEIIQDTQAHAEG